MSIFKQVDQAAVRLIRRGVEPKLVVLTRQQYQDAMAHRDAPGMFGWSGAEQRVPTIVGLPYAVVSGWQGELVLGTPYPPIPKLPDLSAHGSSEVLGGETGLALLALANRVESWDHGSGHKVMAQLVKDIRALAQR